MDVFSLGISPCLNNDTNVIRRVALGLNIRFSFHGENMDQSEQVKQKYGFGMFQSILVILFILLIVHFVQKLLFKKYMMMAKDKVCLYKNKDSYT